jgi:hypothetical protein
MQKIPQMTQPVKPPNPRATVPTFTSLRTGQWPKHPRAQKAPGMERPPNFSDEGDIGNTVWWNNPAVARGTPEQRAPQYSDDGALDYSTFPAADPLGILPDPPEPSAKTYLDAVAATGFRPSSDSIMESNPSSLAEIDPDERQDDTEIDPDEQQDDIMAPPASIADPTANIDARNANVAAGPDSPVPGFFPTHPGPNGPVPTTPQSYSDQIGQFPTNNPPKWWQRALAAGVGGMEGMANAGHARRPIDINQSIQAIENPGYQSKLESWRSKVIPQEIQLDLASKIRQAQMAQAKQQADSAEKQSLAKMYDARAGYYQQLPATRMVTVTPEMEEASNHLYKAGTSIPAANARDIFTRASQQARMVVTKPGDIVFQNGNKVAENTNPRFAPPRPVVTGPQQIVFDANGNKVAENTNQRQFAPRGNGRGIAPQQAFTDIENRKQQRLGAAEQQFLQDHDKEKLAANKAKIQNQYAQEIIRHHETVAPSAPPQGNTGRPPLSAFDK